MYKNFTIKTPFFELGPKAYLYGTDSLKLALAADKISKKYNIQIIYTPQTVDIPIIAKAVKHIYIFSQHIDPIQIGRGIGHILPEAIKNAGTVGTLLNHAEKKMTLNDISKAIKRADEVGLATMVCADNLEEVLAVAQLGPNIILAEPESQIGIKPEGTGTDKSKIEKSQQQQQYQKQLDKDANKDINKVNNIVNSKEYIQKVKEKVKAINPEIKILFSTGIYSGDDVYNIISLGAEATGCTSGVIKADNPAQKLEEMISSMRKAWDGIYNR